MKQNKFIYNQLRFYYHKELITGEKIKFPSHLIHQIFRVLKKRSGDYIFLFNGDKSLEFNNPKIKKTKETMTDQINTEDPEVKGHKPIIKNTAKKTKPKLLFELIFTLDLSNILFF